MSRRLSRYAEARRWKPFRNERPRERPPIGPRGEEWELDAAGNLLRPKIETIPLDEEPEEP